MSLVGSKGVPMSLKPQVLDMPDAEVLFYPAFFDADESQQLLQDLTDNIAWEEQEAKFPWGIVKIPRLVAWYGDAGKSYSYSGVKHEPHGWTETLLNIKARIETVSDTKFNSVLLNMYRSENDSVGWHSDDEPELGSQPIIASVSFGATRPFQFKHKELSANRRTIDLTAGSLLIMRGDTQRRWQHRIPKVKSQTSARINLTFRVIY
jgi:alkylated DNA repair dioxygenase AlkB